MVDVGNEEYDGEDDYPVFAAAVAGRVAADVRAGNHASRGILVCRSAAGMVITANKFANLRAVAVTNIRDARHAREHNDTNVLALSGDNLDTASARRILEAWLGQPASRDGRHARRRQEISRLEQGGVAIIPGIFEPRPDFANAKLRRAKEFSEITHIDVADGRFVPAKAFANPADARKLSRANFEVHLMVDNPADYIEAWKRRGAVRFIAHVEAPGFAEFVTKTRRARVQTVGGLDLGTDPKRVSAYAGRLDGLLVMTVKAGKSGQPFAGSALGVIAGLRRRYPKLSIEADGGINDRTIGAAVAAGADRAVATSYLWRSKRPAADLRLLESAGLHG